MSDCYWMWRGQLCVGSKNIGPTTIWSDRNTLIPDIGVDLKMTSFAEYTVLWDIIGTRNIDLSDGSVNISGKDVSVFSLEGHGPHFEQLSQELTQTSKPQILIGELYNPGIRFVVVIFPNCPEVEKIGLKENSGKIVSSMNVIFISCSSAQKQEDIYRSERSVQLPKMEKAMSCHKSKESYSTRIGAGKTMTEYGNVMQSKEQNDKENDRNNSHYCENQDDVQKPPSEVILKEPQDLEKKKTPKMGLENGGGGMEEKSIKAKHEKSEKGGKDKDRNDNSEGTCHKRGREKSVRSREKSGERADKAICEKSDKGSLSKDRNKNDSDQYHKGHTGKMKSKFLETVKGDGENDGGKYQKDKAQMAESPKKKYETSANRSKLRNKRDGERSEERTRKPDRDEKHHNKCQDREKASHHSGFADSSNVSEVKADKSTDKFHRKYSGKEKEERNFDKKDKKEYVPAGGTNSISAKHSEKNKKNEMKGEGTKMENKKKSRFLKEIGDNANHRSLSNSEDTQEQEHSLNKREKSVCCPEKCLIPYFE
ncbi:micronuclear linker histone polyprotein-like [Macrobrachium rosenbergii]|uniref:micronuclear linker histone polyprotein-like n=1 Tax=Macrobrachium rosenbergii TaxID=79674 RepID=UPI0034D397E0